MTATVRAEALKRFCSRVFETVGLPSEDAVVTANVLVAADLYGIDSHGVARLQRYVDGLREGTIAAAPAIKTVHETATTALIDGGAGLGQVVGSRAMRLAIDKAQQTGAGFVAVRNSNHYGIAGYYAMMALEHDLIGISMTNSATQVVPTFGQDALLGTNPLSVAIPAGEERPFVLDMATSVVARGKLEIRERLGKKAPLGWAIDEKGGPTPDPGLVVKNLSAQAGGGLLPLGGAGEELGGHKGYGLALLVDLLCGILPGAAYADTIYPRDEEGRPLPANVGHFFGALRVDGFRPVDEFKATVDDLIRRVKRAPKAEGQDRIYIHGEKEFEMAEDRLKNGIPLHPTVVDTLKEIGRKQGVEYDL